MKLETKSLTFAYSKIKIINNLELSITSGIHGLIGKNGAGKTTYLNLLTGYLKPDSGHFELDGKQLESTDIVFIETQNFYYKRITGIEYLSLFKKIQPSFDIEAWNILFDLPLDRFIDDYSTGMKKKLAIFSAISLDRAIYIFDEPYNGLDLESVQLMKLIFQKLKENGKMIIITSHILDTLLPICDNIHYLYDGKIKKTYQQEQFQQIESELFEEENKIRAQLIDKLNL